MRGYLRPRDRRKPENRKGPCRQWQLVVEGGCDENGARQQIYQSFAGTKAEAETALRKLVDETETGMRADDGHVTLSEWVETWLAHKTSGAKRVRSSTIDSYRDLLRLHVVPKLGQRRLSAITTADVQRLVDALASGGRLTHRHIGEPLSPPTVSRVKQALGQCMRHAVRMQLIARDPTAYVELPRARRKKFAVLDPAQSRSLMTTACGTRLELPIVLGLGLAMRRGEIFAIQWRDIDFKVGTATVRRHVMRDGSICEGAKTEAGVRTIHLPAFVGDALRTAHAEYARLRLAIGGTYNDAGWVICTPAGDRVNPNGISTLYRRIVRDAAVPRVRFHDLRHSCASLLIAAGAPLPVVAEILGHSDPSVTARIYLHGLEEGHAGAAEALGRMLG